MSVERARALMEAGRQPEAAALLADELAARPEDEEALRLLAWCHLGARAYGEALLVAGRLTRLHPRSVDGHVVASAALAELGRREEARGAAWAAVRADADDWRAHAQLAAVLAGDPEVAEVAVRAAQRAVGLAPGAAGAHAALGRALAGAGRLSEADSAYRRALALDPADPVARRELRGLDATAAGEPGGPDPAGPALGGELGALDPGGEDPADRRQRPGSAPPLPPTVLLWRGLLVLWVSALALATLLRRQEPELTAVALLAVLAVLGGATWWALTRVPAGVRRRLLSSARSDVTTALGLVAVVVGVVCVGVLAVLAVADLTS